MNLYISGSNRKRNCYRICNDLKKDEDMLISLADKNIRFCLGCNKCINILEKYCVLNDDMQEIYKYLLYTDKVIIVTPIYMNHITGILKNVIDRLNPFTFRENILKGKKIYIITVGQMEEDENEEIANNIKEYFEGISEFMEFEVIFLKNFSSGDISLIDDITKKYKNYKDIIEELRKKIEN